MIPDKMVEAACVAASRWIDIRPSAMRDALEAAGVGELIEALKFYDNLETTTKAHTVLEKLGVKLSTDVKDEWENFPEDAA